MTESNMTSATSEGVIWPMFSGLFLMTLGHVLLAIIEHAPQSLGLALQLMSMYFFVVLAILGTGWITSKESIRKATFPMIVRKPALRALIFEKSGYVFFVFPVMILFMFLANGTIMYLVETDCSRLTGKCISGRSITYYKFWSDMCMLAGSVPLLLQVTLVALVRVLFYIHEEIHLHIVQRFLLGVLALAVGFQLLAIFSAV